MDPKRLRATIVSAQSGSAGAYEALLEAYAPRLYGYFFRATGNHHDAEDLLGELTLRLVRHLKSYDDRGRFEPWVFRIAANLVRDRIRRRKSAPPAMSLSREDDFGTTAAERIPSGGPLPEADLLAEDASLALQKALAKLDDTTRQMILLRHFGEMSFKEIAALLECPIGTVLARVHRGLRTLRERMGASDETE